MERKNFTTLSGIDIYSLYIIPIHNEINGFGQSYTFKFIMKFCQGKKTNRVF